ncbi:DUF6545 domain-containing protein [Streptomyces gardneri]|uniref:DUF6545 domain-containing protein n=1 Tax=Streptomyces gardneri TaxID=66892 RepID=UPI0035E1380A
MVLLAKFPALVRSWRNPLIRSVHALLALGCVAYTFSAPPTVAVVNRLTGVSNFSAPLVFCILTMCSYACVVLMERWRADADADPRARRRIRAWAVVCGAVCLAIVVLFVLGDAPVEQRTAFDTYYATTPFIREMLVLYLTVLVIVSVATTVSCWGWARDIRRQAGGGRVSVTVRSLRLGLMFLITGFLGNTAFGVLKLTAIVRRWTGGSWDGLNEFTPRLTLLNSTASTIGFLLPVFAPWWIERVWRPWRSFLALGPLVRAVRPTGPGAGHRRPFADRFAVNPGQLLVYRVTVIRDELLRLRVYCKDAVREDAYRAARLRGADGSDAVVLGLAAMLEEAVAARAAAVPASREQCLRAVLALRTADAEDPDLLVRLSRAQRALPGLRRPGGPVAAGCAAGAPVGGA